MTDSLNETGASGRSTLDDWVTVFLRFVLSLFVGLPLGGLLFALWTISLDFYSAGPITQAPWSLALKTLVEWVSFIVFGGFSWTPENGYHSLHGWYAAGVVLSFVVLMKPWRRTRRSR